MNEKKLRPGVMLYFDRLCPALMRLTSEECGELLRGIIEYAQTGAIPEMDGMTGMASDMLRPGIDYDGERYEYKRLHGQYMAFCRTAKERGEKPVTEEEFIQQQINADRHCQQATPTSPHTLTASPSSYPNRDVHGKGEAEGYKGEGRENRAYDPLPEQAFEDKRRQELSRLTEYRKQ